MSLPSSPQDPRAAVERPLSSVAGALLCVLAAAAWSLLALVSLVRAVTDGRLGVLFGVIALGAVVATVALPPANPFKRFLNWLGRGSQAGRNLAIMIIVGPCVVLAIVFGVDPGRFLSALLWLVGALVCGLFVVLVASGCKPESRAKDGIRMRAAGPGIFAAVISTFFTLGVLLGDDPWSNWMLAGFALGVLGILADACWALPASRRYVESLAPHPADDPDSPADAPGSPTRPEVLE